MTNRKMQYWVIPPEADAEFVAAMEEVLETYEEPYNPEYPVVCMDEQPVQLHKEIRQPIPATKQHARRVDYEYERCGTASIFLFTEPLAGWREVTAGQQRTKVDWALEIERLLTGKYRRAKKIILICDNLNTHTKGAFYEAFQPAKARSLVKRIDFRHTPKHGSWLNAAVNSLKSKNSGIFLVASKTKLWRKFSKKHSFFIQKLPFPRSPKSRKTAEFL
jgi:hypothetical protein